MNSFLQNARDVTVKYGLPVASIGFAAGSLWLLGLNKTDDVRLFRQVLWPVFSLAGNALGLMNRKRNANTLSAFGSASMLISACGGDGDDFAPALAGVNALGVIVMGMGSDFVPKARKEKEDKELETVMQSGLVKTALGQTAGNVLQLAAAFIDHKTQIMGPMACWVGASVLKLTQAVFEAKDKIAGHRPA